MKNLKELNPHSITAILEPRLQEVYSCNKSSEVYSLVKQLLDTNNINTEASRRLLNKLQRSKSNIESMNIITNSVLAGNGLAVI